MGIMGVDRISYGGRIPSATHRHWQVRLRSGGLTGQETKQGQCCEKGSLLTVALTLKGTRTFREDRSVMHRVQSLNNREHLLRVCLALF